MIIVDDRLSLEVLAGRAIKFKGAGPVATTWSFHFRLVRALADDTRVGRLTRANTEALRRVAAAPPPGLLVVLDPREVTQVAAEVAIRHRLNLLAAELVAAAKVHAARIALAATNVGRNWPDVLRAEGIKLQVVT